MFTKPALCIGDKKSGSWRSGCDERNKRNKRDERDERDERDVRDE